MRLFFFAAAGRDHVVAPMAGAGLAGWAFRAKLLSSEEG